jgi:hypothetical protein
MLKEKNNLIEGRWHALHGIHSILARSDMVALVRIERNCNPLSNALN